MSISLDKAVIARYNHKGLQFEILVDPDKAFEIRSGKKVPSISDIVAIEEVYTDARKGLRASAQDLTKAFGTNDFEKIALKIILDGEVQLTTEQRARLQDEKERAVAAIIAREGINPQTNAPHPPERIMKAMKEAKVQIKYDRPAEEQVQDVLKAVQRIIPIHFEHVRIAVKIPPEYSGKAANVVHGFGNISKEEWGSDGSYLFVIEMPAGLQTEFYDKLNSITRGTAQAKLLKR